MLILFRCGIIRKQVLLKSIIRYPTLLHISDTLSFFDRSQRHITENSIWLIRLIMIQGTVAPRFFNRLHFCTRINQFLRVPSVYVSLAESNQHFASSLLILRYQEYSSIYSCAVSISSRSISDNEPTPEHLLPSCISSSTMPPAHRSSCFTAKYSLLYHRGQHKKPPDLLHQLEAAHTVDHLWPDTAYASLHRSSVRLLLPLQKNFILITDFIGRAKRYLLSMI